MVISSLEINETRRLESSGGHIGGLFLYRVFREHLKEVRNKQYIYQGREDIMLGSRKLMFRESLLYEIFSYFTLECIIWFFSFKNWSVVIYSTMLVSDVQHSELYVYLYVYIFSDYLPLLFIIKCCI